MRDDNFGKFERGFAAARDRAAKSRGLVGQTAWMECAIVNVAWLGGETFHIVFWRNDVVKLNGW